MSDWFDMKTDPAHIKKEREKARKLRKSPWWKQELAKGVCHYCGKTFKPEDLTMDHIVPISRGGKSNKGNVVPCCKNCNNQKKYHTPAEILLNKLKKERDDKS